MPPTVQADSLRALFESSDLTAELDARQLAFVRGRWLDQLAWNERNARRAKRRYEALRLSTVIGGVIVPAMISITLALPNPDAPIRWATFAVSLLVAISAALEEALR